MSTPHADVDDADRLARIKLGIAIELGDLRPRPGLTMHELRSW